MKDRQLANISEDKRAVDAVFEGGGVKGIGLVGAASVVEEHGYQWSNLAGTSAGAIVASLLAAGYHGPELKNIIGSVDYLKFKDQSGLGSLPVVGPLAGLIWEKGIYAGKYFETWLRELLNRKNVRTFKDLIMDEFKDDERYRFKLRVIASDITNGRMLVLPQDIARWGIKPEDLDVASAVRMSMSIPFFFRPVGIQSDADKKTSFIVDGGVLSNFPVWLFDTENSIPEWPTFGFKLVEPEEGSPHLIKGPIGLLTALFNTMMEAHDARYIQDQHFARTIPIPTLGIKTTEFDITPARTEALYQSGRKGAEDFLASWNFNEYIEKYRLNKPPVHRRQLINL
jgi:NTE family protein